MPLNQLQNMSIIKDLLSTVSLHENVAFPMQEKTLENHVKFISVGRLRIVLHIVYIPNYFLPKCSYRAVF